MSAHCFHSVHISYLFTQIVKWFSIRPNNLMNMLKNSINKIVGVIVMISVLSSQNDAKLENGELATDLISAIKEFEETTAKITSAHSQTNEQDYQMGSKTTERTLEHYQTDEKGPIEYFNRTKETLRHVEQSSHHIDQTNSSSRIYQSAAAEATNVHQHENDGGELEDDYVKIPVQQLINSFERQMRSIIKQKINENIQLKLDGTSASSNKTSAAYMAANTPTMTTTAAAATATATMAPIMITNRDNDECDIADSGKPNGNVYENENEMKPFIDYDAMYVSRHKSVDFNSMVCQQQQQLQLQQQTATKQIECHEMTQSTIVESATNRFSNSNETKADRNFDGGKAQKLFIINPTRFAAHCICSLMSL